MEKYALIVAGGSGSRMGGELPKQFLLLNGKPLLWHTIQTFQHAFPDIYIILVVPSAYRHHETMNELNLQNIKIVAGGDTRFHSVKNGLEEVASDTIVFVHDGVRCLVTTDLIQRCYEQAIRLGSAIPVVSATDSLRMDKDGSHSVIDRNHIRIVQTPQTFASNDLKAAFAQPYQSSFTDEATVVEANGKKVFLIEGEYENIKITRPLDLLVAESILQQRLNTR